MLRQFIPTTARAVLLQRFTGRMVSTNGMVDNVPTDQPRYKQQVEHWVNLMVLDVQVSDTGSVCSVKHVMVGSGPVMEVKQAPSTDILMQFMGETADRSRRNIISALKIDGNSEGNQQLMELGLLQTMSRSEVPSWLMS